MLWSFLICALLQLLIVMAYLTLAVSIRSLISFVPAAPSRFHRIAAITFRISCCITFICWSFAPSVFW
mgnify:CR=1 FL=1